MAIRASSCFGSPQRSVRAPAKKLAFLCVFGGVKKKGASDIKRWLRNTLTIETREKYGANVVRREKNKNVQRPAAATFQRSADGTRDEEEGTFRDRLSHRDEVVFPAAQFWSGG